MESRDLTLLEALEPYRWGLLRFEIEESSLANHVLAAKSLRAVLPGGAFVDVPGNARLPNCRIDPKSTEPGRPLHVSVGLRRVEARRPQALAQGSPHAESKFLVAESEVYDLDAGSDPVPVEFLDHDLRFFLGQESTDGFDALRVCTLTLTGNPARPVAVAPAYAPPCLAISASPLLHQTAKGVLERLATVLRDFGHVRDSEKVKELIQYQALAGFLPVLRDMVVDGAVHPRLAYREMARLAGALYFKNSARTSFEDIPAYDHDEPGPVFDRLHAMIVQMSEFVFVERYKRVPLRREGDRFLGAMPAEGRQRGIRLFFEAEAAESASKIPVLLKMARVSSAARLEFLERAGLIGIATDAQPGPPHELPPRTGAEYFRIKTEGAPEWDTHAVNAQEIGISIPLAPHDLKLNLVVILPER